MFYILVRYICVIVYSERINRTEVKILKMLSGEIKTVTTLADALEKSKNYISECVSHLSDMGFVSTEREGHTVFISISQRSIGNELSKLLQEEPMLNLVKFIGNSRLKMLPLLLEPGSSAREISARTKLSARTIQSYLGSWRQMGIAVLYNKIYNLNEKNKIIYSFVEKYTEHRNLSHLKEKYADGVLVWQKRDEYIFSIGKEIFDNEYTSAATSRLAELNYDIIYKNEYYYYSPIHKQTDVEEALIQSLKFNLRNPRIKKFINMQIINNIITKNHLVKLSKKYNVEKELEAILDAKETEIQ